MRGKKHPPDTKAAVMAALLAGQSADEVAKAYDLPITTIKEWQQTADSNEFVEVRRKKSDQIGAMLMDYLQENLTTLKAQVQFFRDEKWLREQSASDVAVLHGVCTDKAIRLLEAIERAQQAQAYQPIAGELPASTTEPLPS